MTGLFVNLEASEYTDKSDLIRRIYRRLSDAGVNVGFRSLPVRPSTAPESPASHFATGVLLDKYLDPERPAALLDGRDTIFRREVALIDEQGMTIGHAPLGDVISADSKQMLAAIIDQKLAQVLFSVNRREAMEGPDGLVAMLNDYEVVLTNRYLSAYSYGVAGGVSLVELTFLEEDLPKPDLNFLLDIDPATRRRREGAIPDRLEADATLQSKVRRAYAEMLREDAEAADAEGRLPHWVRLDAAAPNDELAEHIANTIVARSRIADLTRV
jgi:thymidylate kinase